MKRYTVDNDKPTLYIAVGPAGSGKSTTYRKLQALNPNIEHYSWDNLRHEFYDPDDYAKAYQMSTEDKTFGVRVRQRFLEVITKNQDIYVDNVNLTKKTRKTYVEIAKKLNYNIVAITFSVPLETLLARQFTRGDKNVPDYAVKQQFDSHQPPSLDEGFDRIIPSHEIN